MTIETITQQIHVPKKRKPQPTDQEIEELNKWLIRKRIHINANQQTVENALNENIFAPINQNPLPPIPNQQVSFTAVVEDKDNYKELRLVNWPTIELKIPYASTYVRNISKHTSNHTCSYCDMIRDTFVHWYALHPELLKIHVANVSSLTKNEYETRDFVSTITDPTKHNHSISVNNMELDLPTLSLPRRHTSTKEQTGGVDEQQQQQQPKPEHVQKWCNQLQTWLRQQFYTDKDKLKSASTFKPHDYQEALLKYIKQFEWDTIKNDKTNNTLMIQWKQGTGKTDGVLYAIQGHAPDQVVIVSDNSVLDQWMTHVQMFPQLKGETRYRIYGDKEFQKCVQEDPKLLKGCVFVVDESHRYRNLSSFMMDALRAKEHAMYTFLLTGTPLVNQPTDKYHLDILFGLAPLAELQDILKYPQRYNKTHHIPQTSEELADMWNKYRNKIFYYEPENSLPTVRKDIYVEMTYPQTLQYVMESTQKPVIGPFQFQTATRNSFDSKTSCVSNCIMKKDKPNEVAYSPKFDAVVEYIRQCSLVPNREKLPIVVYSEFLNRGVDAIEQYLKSQPWAKTLTIRKMTSLTAGPEREVIRREFNDGNIDVLLLSPIAQRSLDLLDAAVIILLEVPESEGQESQIITRVLRSGAKQRRPNMVIEIVRTISTFAKKPITPDQMKMLENDFLYMLSSRNREHAMSMYKESKINILSALMKAVDKLKVTCDERRDDRNDRKDTALKKMKIILKCSSIPFKNTQQNYLCELETIIGTDLLAKYRTSAITA